MSYTSKAFKNYDFVLYDSNDEIVCYFSNFDELSKYINYKLFQLVYEYKRHNTNIINVVIDDKKYKLAIFC